MDPYEFLADPADEQGSALIAALRKQQERQDAERAGLHETLERQQGQAGGLRTLSLLTSMGDNPLLRGIQRASGDQGSQMEGLAARTEQRLAQPAGGGLGLLDVIRARQAQQRLGHAADALKVASRRAAGAAAGASARAEKKEAADLVARETGYRKEYTGNALVKDYETSATALDELHSHASGRNPASDLAMVFGFMKALDPTSVVKEGEQQQVRNTTNIPGRYLNMLQQAASGQSLSPEQRQELVQVAGRAVGAKKKKADALKANYRRIAQETGVDPSRVVLDLDEPVPHAAPAPAKEAPTPSPQDSAALSWAKANANDPRAVKILERLKSKGVVP